MRLGYGIVKLIEVKMSDSQVKFNYIITIHNKEKLIKDVLLSVMNSARAESWIYPVLDGCTDGSEAIIDEIISSYPDVNIKKLYAPDVHELKSINIGLRGANQDGEIYNIILQDDVLLQDTDLEKKCVALYRSINNLGIVSFRHGGNISRGLIQKTAITDPLSDYIENECGHNPHAVSVLRNGFFVFREIAIKSPICIPSKVIREIGIPDENYAPWDDIAYCYKVSQAGYSNGVFALDFRSDVDWGTTREKIQVVKIDKVQQKNLNLFRRQNPTLSNLDSHKYGTRKVQIFESNRQYPFNFSTFLKGLYHKVAYPIKHQLKVLLHK